MGKTLFDKVWDAHVVDAIENGPQILYIDTHLIHEVTSPQAFERIRKKRGIPIARPDKNCGYSRSQHAHGQSTFTH